MGFVDMLIILPIAGALYFIFGALYSLPRLPQGWSNPWKTHCILFAMKLIGGIAGLGRYFGYHPIFTARYVIDNVYPKLFCLFSTANLNEKVSWKDIVIQDIKVRVYNKKNPSPEKTDPHSLKPGLVYIHGGGYVFGSIAMTDKFVKRLVSELDCTAISIEYRLAPEHTYPTALGDCLKVIRHFFREAEKDFSVDKNSIALVGDGTGGTLCIASCLKLLDENFSHQPIAMALLYPATQAFNLNTPSYQYFQSGPILTRNAMAFSYSLYAEGSNKNCLAMRNNQHVPRVKMDEMMSSFMNINDLPQDDILAKWVQIKSPEQSSIWDEFGYLLQNNYFSPLMVDEKKLSALPSTYLAVSTYDILRDDGIWFAKKLKTSNVNVKTCLTDTFNGWITFSKIVQTADQETLKLIEFLIKSLCK